MLNPAYIGMNKPIKRYKEVIAMQSIKLGAVKAIMKIIKSCNETLTFIPKGIENIPTRQSNASITPS